MPLSWTEGMPPAPHLNAWCKLNGGEHGLIASGPRNVLLMLVSNHFAEAHADTNLIVQNEAFTIEVAPLRCDVCNGVAELPYWTRTVTPEQFAGDADGKWLVCDPCEVLLKADDLQGLIDRHAEQSLIIAPTLAGDPTFMEVIKVQIAAVLEVLTADEAVVTRDEATG